MCKHRRAIAHIAKHHTNIKKKKEHGRCLQANMEGFAESIKLEKKESAKHTLFFL